MSAPDAALQPSESDVSGPEVKVAAPDPPQAEAPIETLPSPAPQLQPPVQDATPATVEALDEGVPQEDAGNLSDNGMGAFSVDLSIDTDSDADSSLGDMERMSSTMSVSTSVFDFVEKFGRTWHKYKEGTYFLPNDEQEQNRLDMQHEMSRRLLGGKLNFAPVESASRAMKALDIGTGTGVWAIEFAEEHPNIDVVGTDLSPIQPEHVPPNCRFEIDDAEDDWVWSSKFDYVHGRYITPFLKDIPKLLKNIYDNLNPGGYVELLEGAMLLRAVDDTLKGPGKALVQWNELMNEGVRKVGRNPLAPLQLHNIMADVGFVNIVDRRIPIPINTWPRGKDQKIIGAMEQMNLLDLAESMTKNIFVHAHGWSVEEVEVFLVTIRANIKDTGIHAYIPAVAIYAQKPESQTE